MFNIYINDTEKRLSGVKNVQYLHNDIEKRLSGVNNSPITIDNGTNISYLLYADDIFIMSLSEERLQKWLDELNKFCKECKLTISMKKTTCILFQKQNKVNKRSAFS